MGLKEIARCDKIRVAERGESEGGLVRSPSDSQGNGLPPNKIAQKCVQNNGCTSHQNLKEVLELCLEEYSGAVEDLPRFVGLQQIEVAG
ncbi:hypothetical protein J7M22_02805 [Candidatus Poribacteria bacterium]|nr:hypothetical protein [Candidatus Poribacteria bacterium]